MGLFDRLLNHTAKALGNAMLDAVQEAAAGNRTQNNSAPAAVDYRSFEQKLTDILQSAGSYELRKKISIDELEQQYGQIWNRKRRYALPEAISYAVCVNGAPVLYIRLWNDYGCYSRVANREIKQFCDTYGVKMLDFFDYLPNRADYMAERITANLPRI